MFCRTGRRLHSQAMLPPTAVVFVLIILLSPVGRAQETPGAGRPPDAAMQAAVVDSISAALNDTYVFPDVAKKMERLIRKNLKEGTYKGLGSVRELCDRLTQDLQSVSHDKHLRIVPLPPGQAGEQGKPSPEEERAREIERRRHENFGFKKVELLPGNIGYIDFRYFAEAEYAGATAIAAMNFLANTDALIFDLRQNGGGNPSMIQLITSYLFEEPVHLNSFYIRKEDKTNQFWTQAWVEGPRLAHTPVYVLTSGMTFSGAEEFTYNLKNLKRGTIVGETTGGGAHPVELRAFESLGVGMSLPFGRAVNPITGTNWEGTGVEPDIKVPADQALTVARIEATKMLLEKEKSEDARNLLTWSLEALEVERNPVILDEKALQAYVGTYGPRKIWLDGGALYYQREGRPKYRLVPMGEDTFLPEGLDYFRLQFSRDQSGGVVELIGLYDNGQRDSNKRDGS